MAREVVDGSALRLEHAAPERIALLQRHGTEEEDEGDDDDDDFELETMEDDDDDAMDGLLADGMETTIQSSRDDTIAHRTRTKLSLVNVEMDLLESLLPPDAAESELFSEVHGDEYQRFLSSLLPTVDDEDNLSFLDEEGEEYHPEEEDDDEEEDEEASARRRGARKTGSPMVDDDEEEQLDVRVSKKELTELLWDSTRMSQVKVPPTFPRSPHVPGKKQQKERRSTRQVASIDPLEEIASLADAAALKDINGTISQEQCIQLASQMHKHFQLLLQTYHLIASAKYDNNEDELDAPTSSAAAEKDAAAHAPASSAADSAADSAIAVLLPECETMLRDLQVRGKRALEHKARLLSKLSNSVDQQASTAATSEKLEQRRVTRSISAAHAAVAHPSMFDIVGSQSMEQLTTRFSESCSINERNEALQGSMLEVDKHLLLSRKKKKPRPGTRAVVEKIAFTSAEDRLLLQGVKYYGVTADAWLEIQRALIPTKSVQLIAKRYRYLSSSRKRAGAKELKVHHNEYHSRRRGEWAIEEDVRVARGVVEYFGDNRRFARIAGKYLPHRHRLEIRKRWGKLKQQYQIEDGSVVEDSPNSWSAASKAFAKVVKTFLEGKLRAQAPAAAAEVVTQLTAAATLPTPSDGSNTAGAAGRPAAGIVGCRAKNLHPSLFFSSWAVINPTVLLARTCEHNWPAFIEEKRKGDSSASTLAIVSSAAVSRVEEETAQHRADLASRAALATIAEEDEDDGDEPSLGMLEDDDEEDSEYEREELLSSEDEDSASSNSEYELMELSDDEDDDDDDDEGVNGDDEDANSAGENQAGAALRLEHLKQSDGRAHRALAALERRLTGKASADESSKRVNHPEVTSSVASIPPEDRDEVDLLAYEELSDLSEDDDDEGFEQEELLGTSEDESDQDMDAVDSSKRIREVSSLHVPKRIKLSSTLSRCSDCGGLPCVCASARMQRLLQRIQPRGATLSE